MPTPKSKSSAPHTFELPVSLIAKIARARRGHALGSASEVVRLALAEFDVASFQPTREPHVQISVRLMGKQRAELARAAKRKDARSRKLRRLPHRGFRQGRPPSFL